VIEARLQLEAEVPWQGDEFDQRVIATSAALVIAAQRVGVRDPRVYRTDMADRGITVLTVMARVDV